MSTPVTAEEEAEICRLADKFTQIEVAEIVDRSRQTILRVLRNNGRISNRVDPNEEAEMAAAYERGESIRTIADIHGRPYQTVSRVLHRRGVEMRRRGAPARWDPAVFAKLWREERLTAPEIEIRTGASAATVRRVLRRAGLYGGRG